MRISRILFAGLLALAPLAPAATLAQTEAADTTSPVAALTQTMQIAPLFDVLREEGLAYGKSVEQDMFPGSGGTAWAAEVAAIYDIPTLRKRFDTALEQQLAADPAAVTDMVAFFGSDLGQRILSLEIDARRAFLDDGVEEAAQVAADKLRADKDPRIDLVTHLADANDLIEMNVAGSLTGSLAFLQGMTREGLNGAQVDEDQMMSDVWGQEEQVRADTTTWLYSYLTLAYQPLSDAELQAYIDFSETVSGQKLNAALFASFDAVFKQVSYDLGRAAVRAMQGSDI